MTRADDSWRNAGSGRRLDGKRPGNGESTVENNKPLNEMTDDEMLQMAMAASLEQLGPTEINKSYELTDEPADDAEGAVKIQFRLPDGTRAVRQFLDSEQVGVLYSYVKSKCSKQGVELRAGYPPKSLESRMEETIAESKLAGETIHGRYV